MASPDGWYKLSPMTSVYFVIYILGKAIHAWDPYVHIENFIIYRFCAII